MKKLLIVSLLTLSASWLVAQENVPQVDWLSWQEVEQRMAEEPRKVMVDVYTQWCGPCKMMNKITFKDPETVAYINEHYYAIKFDAEGPEEVSFKGNIYKNDGYDPNRNGRNSTHDLTKAIAPANGRIAYPTIVYMDENFQILAPVQGMQRPEQIKPILSFFGEDIYKEKTWKEYSEGG